MRETLLRAHGKMRETLLRTMQSDRSWFDKFWLWFKMSPGLVAVLVFLVLFTVPSTCSSKNNPQILPYVNVSSFTAPSTCSSKNNPQILPYVNVSSRTDNVEVSEYKRTPSIDCAYSETYS